MGHIVTYDGGTLTNVRLDDAHGAAEYVERADHGEIGSGSVTIDDPAGTQLIIGHKSLVAEEDDCTFARTFTGYVGPRDYEIGIGPNPARLISATLFDLNARLGFLVLRRHFGDSLAQGGKRPRESISDRLTWLLGTTYMAGVADNGFVDYPSTMLDKNDYRGQFPADVLRDMALVAKFNYFVYWDDPGGASLWFRDSNASTAFSCTLRFSGDINDIDNSTTFEIGKSARLNRDPSETISGEFRAFANGNVYRNRAATEDTYEPRDGVAPSSSVKKRATAIALADADLKVRRNEDDTITDSWLLPATKINLVRAGMRVLAKYPRIATEGYGDFNWFRILETRKRPLVAPDEQLYTCAVTLSPQEICSVQPTFIQHKYSDGSGIYGLPAFTETWPFPAATVPGNLVVVSAFSGFLTGASILTVPTGWNAAFLNYDTSSAGPGDQSTCSVFWKKSEGESSIDIKWQGHPNGSNVRYNMAEYAGLKNPVLYDSDINRQDPGVGAATTPTISYPSGPAALVYVCFMEDGPQLTDDLSVDGPAILRTAIHGADHGSRESAIADQLIDTTAGSDSDRFLFTGGGDTLTIGLTFTGDVC